MAKVKRGGTNPIDHVDELNDTLLMRFWIRKGTKSKKRSPFVFKKRCAYLSDDPLLIVGRVGKKIKGSLVRATRVGSKTIRGFMFREGKILVIETKDVKTKSDQQKIARFFYATLGKYKVRIPLKHIVLRNPEEKPVEVSSPKQKKPPKQKSSSKKREEEPSSEDETSEESFSEENSENITPEEWKEQESLLNEDSEEEEEEEGEVILLEQTRTELKEIEAKYKNKRRRQTQKELQIKAYQLQLEKEEKQAQEKLLVEQSFREECLTVHDAAELSTLLSRAPLSKSAQKRIRTLPESERLDGVLQELRYTREARERAQEAKREKLLERDKSLDKKQIKNLELSQEHLDKKEELSLVVCKEKALEISNCLTSMNETPHLGALMEHHHFKEQWQELKQMLSQLQQHPKHEEFQMGQGAEIAQREAKYKSIEENYDRLIQSFDDAVENWKRELRDLAQEIQTLPLEHQPLARKKYTALSKTLDHAIQTMHKAVHKQQEYTQKARLLEEVGTITADLIGDRREQSPSTPIHHTDPIDDLRLVNTRIHKRLVSIIEITPSLRIMICHLIYRIQHIQGALDEKEAAGEKIQMASNSEIDGPLTPLWEQIPKSSDPNRFVSEYQKWCALENRMWYLLDNPLETRTR